MNTASAPPTAAARSAVNESRPAAILVATSASSPGSKIGTSPARSRAIFAASWSTQLTDSPNSEKHAPDTSPTYPVPIIAIRIRAPLRSAQPNASQNGGAVGPWHSASVQAHSDVSPTEDPATCGCPICDGPAAPTAGLQRGFLLRL